MLHISERQIHLLNLLNLLQPDKCYFPKELRKLKNLLKLKNPNPEKPYFCHVPSYKSRHYPKRKLQTALVLSQEHKILLSCAVWLKYKKLQKSYCSCCYIKISHGPQHSLFISFSWVKFFLINSLYRKALGSFITKRNAVFPHS